MGIDGKESRIRYKASFPKMHVWNEVGGDQVVALQARSQSWMIGVNRLGVNWLGVSRGQLESIGLESIVDSWSQSAWSQLAWSQS